MISPLLANLFLHYTVDRWMVQYHLNIPFGVSPTTLSAIVSEAQAKELKDALEKRFAARRAEFEVLP